MIVGPGSRMKLIQVVGFCACIMIACVSCNRKSGTASQPENEHAPGVGKLNACSLITQEDAEMLFGKGAKLLFHPFFNECFVVEATTPESDTYRPSPSHPFMALRVFARDYWEKQKSPNPDSDRPIEGLGDEAIDQGGAIAFRKGDNCFLVYGYSHTQHPNRELADRIVSRL